jgi:HEAT repeat protein
MVVGIWVALAVPAPVRAQDLPPDPVEALRESLIRAGGLPDFNPQMAKHRAKILEDKVAALKTVGQMRQALALTEWGDHDRINPSRAAVDAQVRKILEDNFRKQLTRAIKEGDEPARLAAVHVLGSLASVRSLTKDLHGLGRSMTPLVVKLCRDESNAVCVAAAKALARMNPDPETAAATFKTLLQDRVILVRRAAAAGLGTLVTESLNLRKKGRGNEGIEASYGDVLAAAKSAVEVAGPGSGDADAQVRRLCLEAIKAAAVALHSVLPNPFDQMPRPGEPMTDFQKRFLAEAQKTLKLEQEQFLPLVKALKAQSQAIHTGLQDADEGVIREAAGVIEELAVVNQRLRAREASIPQLVNGELKPAVVEDHFGKDLRAAVPLLAKQLAHPSVDVKLAVLYALETLDRDAAPAVDAVVKALDDANPFVRWGAARALGRMAGFGGPEVVKAVTALGKHLSDENGRVRTTAAVALARYGPAAKSAVKDLAAAVQKGDSNVSQLAMRALAAIGAEAKPALPELIEALTAKEAPVRLAAARTLGQLGPVAKEALPRLRVAMDDADAAVSLAAADAILAITPAGK